MKKLYRKGTIHPTPSVVSDHLLSFLPAAILALTVALSPSDKEVLAYLVSCSSPTTSTHRKRSDEHAPSFSCNCFGCYISYWVRWDTSPNRQLIHEIIDAYEDTLLKKAATLSRTCNSTSKRDKRKGKKVKTNGYLSNDDAGHELMKKDLPGEAVVVLSNADDVAGGDDCADVSEAAVSEEKGSVRRFVSFLGQSFWGGVWG